MTTRRLLLAPVFALAVAVTAASAASADAPAATATADAAFAKLQSLAGEWSGTVTEKGTGPKALVQYRLIGNRSTVVETLFPGTSHEMVTMFHRNAGRVVLTHYCAMGNQPEMELAPESTPDDLRFNFTGGHNIDPGKGVHMHSGRIRFLSADEVEAEWLVHQDGKPAGYNRFFLQRAAAPAKSAASAPASAAPAKSTAASPAGS